MALLSTHPWLEDYQTFGSFHWFVGSWEHVSNRIPTNLSNIAASILCRTRDIFFLQILTLFLRVLTPAFQNEVIAALDKQRLHLNAYPSLGAYTRAYDNTLPGSPLRRYLIAIVGSSSINPSQSFLDEVCRDVLVDMTKYMRRPSRREWGEFSEEDLKDFYVEETKVSHTPIAHTQCRHSINIIFGRTANLSPVGLAHLA